MLRLRLSGEGALLVLALGLCEPLLCILHCTYWMPLHQQATSAAQHDHAHMPAGASASPSHHQSHQHQAVANQQPSSSAQHCALGGAAESSPDTLTARPFHESVLPLTLMFSVLIFISQAVLPERFILASIPHSPPLRPPILDVR